MARNIPKTLKEAKAEGEWVGPAFVCVLVP